MQCDHDYDHIRSASESQVAPGHDGRNSADNRVVVDDDDIDIERLLHGNQSEECDDSEILRALDDEPVVRVPKVTLLKLASAPSPEQQHVALEGEPVAVAPVEPRSIPDYAAMWEEQKLQKKRRGDAARQRRHRAKPKETSVTTLYNALKRATGNPGRDKLLQQLRGREFELATFRNFSRIIIARHTRPLSDADLAHQLEPYWGEPINRKKVWQLRGRVTRLEAEGMPWRNL